MHRLVDSEETYLEYSTVDICKTCNHTTNICLFSADDHKVNRATSSTDKHPVVEVSEEQDKETQQDACIVLCK